MSFESSGTTTMTRLPTGIRCPACGHTRTRLDPLPETQCSVCGVPYATSQRNMELGLLEPTVEALRPHCAERGGKRGAALLLALLIAVVGGGYLVLAPAEAPEGMAAPSKGSIPASASTQPQ